MNYHQIVTWLLAGDESIHYQVYRDLLSANNPDLQQKISSKGWGAWYLAQQRPDGHWGLKFYQPKWTSSHYTLMDLKNLGIDPYHPKICNIVEKIALEEKGSDGGINPAGSVNQSDVCINGMFLNYACYFKIESDKLKSVVDFILSQKMPDGGFNCRLNRSGARHSSLHTTLSVLEGITEYERNGYTYRLDELKIAQRSSIEFILMHQLYKSDKTGMIIQPGFLKFPYPPRWRYDILRALDYFSWAKIPWDERMRPALDHIFSKRNKYGTWNQMANYPGQVHFEIEKAGQPGRWNTLRVLRVVKHFGLEDVLI
ncbi:MAG: hypothetical protein K9G76_06255 [Bacteroidales bacterium]|nr:hypothetical protein [Bacteroidales bacterium]MCF8402369.1 hypothetical protein [Bacteroidales bacterium]